MILVGDIGGTKVRLAIVSMRGKIELCEEEFFLSRNFSSFEDLLETFLRKTKKKISQACIGVAGPVVGEKMETTNLPWRMDAKKIQKILNARRVDLLNDLEATAYGICMLEEKDFFVLQKGKNNRLGNAALIAAGTGLGEAGLVWKEKEFFPFASEGGHADFSPHDEREWRLFCDLKKKREHVSYESVVSRSGIVSLFSFLLKEKKREAQRSLKKLDKEDLSEAILQHAGGKKDALCEEAVLWFCSLYGREAGNLALKFWALGGVYLAGGIAPQIAQIIKQSDFVSSFHDKGRFAKFLRHIPVQIILNEKAPLLGAAFFARKHLAKTV